MAIATTGTLVALTSQDATALFVKPVEGMALALNPAVSTIFRSREVETHIPVVLTDAGAAWTAEGDQIVASDADVDEIIVQPRKVAGITIVSNEAAADTSPQATSVVGDGLARSCAAKIDAAFFQQLAAPAPAGLASLTTMGTATAAKDFADGTDAFERAVAIAEGVGANITAFIAGPVDALSLATLREGSSGKRNLLQADPTRPTQRTISGRPLLVSRFLAPGTIWAVDATRVISVVRQDADVQASKDAAFDRDSVAVRATMRVGWGFPHPEALVKITRATA